MEITINQALQRAIAVHKNGNLHEAEKLYRAILKVHTNHPDANHNLGVLAVSVGNTDAALPYFKIALDNNPKQEQFWLSYLDALVKLGQMELAKQVLEKSKNTGIKGKKFEQLEAQLSKTFAVASTDVSPKEPSSTQINNLLSIYNQRKGTNRCIQTR